jgi:endonuclease YncB( thermonuclease family)
MSAAKAELRLTNKTKRTLNMAVSLNCYVTTPLTISLIVAALLAASTAHAKDGTITGTCHVVDGDTIFVVTPDASRTEVRLNGVAAPEPREPGGKQATEYLKAVCEDQPVKCELDGSKTRGREVGTCYVNDADIGGAVITKGLARDCTRFSGGRYTELEKPEAKYLAYPGYCSPR